MKPLPTLHLKRLYRRAAALLAALLAGLVVAGSALATGYVAARYGLRPEPFYLGVGFVAWTVLGGLAGA